MRKPTPYAPVAWKNPRQFTVEQRQALVAQRDAWLREIHPNSLFHSLFDLIPGVYFFAKNRKGEIMFTCRASRKLYHLDDEIAAIGLSDFALNPSEMAAAYVHDDQTIYDTGKPILNRTELWFDEQGMPDWFVVNKLPILSRAGETIGIMGFSQSFEGRTRLLTPFRGISNAVNHVRQNYAEPIEVSQLAKLAGLSLRQLQRKFHATFNVSPQEFLVKTRILAACRALRQSEDNIGEIAYSCGFTDQSAFNRHFHHHIGVTPSEFRRRGQP